MYRYMYMCECVHAYLRVRAQQAVYAQKQQHEKFDWTILSLGKKFL